MRMLSAEQYVASLSEPPDPVLRDLTAETVATAPNLQSTHYEGLMTAMLTRVVAPRRAVVLGTFTGYSTLCMARAMPPDGRILACEINAEWAAVAEKYWARAGVADRIELRVGPADAFLRDLPGDPPVDLAHVGADKVNHLRYYEQLLPLLRTGGVMIIGDALRGGLVLDQECRDEDVVAVREFNTAVAGDDRVHSLTYPAGDGVTIVYKR
ncbi:O-methyltransferase [Actinomadura kijaniata]|uniref:O-methyltransferase n=1 Tax=Actinomadura kijaniata TaxID=46161 RepID=UPI003F19A889